MSEHFVKTFNAENKCAGCKSAKLVVGKRVYSLCTNHLAVARKQWHKWSKRRRREGLCIRCDSKSFNGWLRCRNHREENRIKCLAWNKLHPEHQVQQWEKSKALRDAGYCPSCREHRPLPTGFKRCDSCRKRQNARA